MSASRLPQVHFTTRPRFGRLWGACLAAALAAGLSAWSSAGPPKPPKPQPFTADGSIVDVQNGALTVNTSKNQTMTITVTPATRVRVVGTAKPEGIRPGMCVEFVVDLDEHHQAQTEIGRLTIFTAGTRTLGLLPASAASPKPPPPGKRGKQRKRDDAATSNGNPGVSIGVDREDADSDGPTKPPAVRTVRGTVKKVVNNCTTLKVAAGKFNVTADLAEGAELDVDLSDWSHVSCGDRIHVSGDKIHPRGSGPGPVCAARSVRIDMAQPLSGKKHGPRKTAGPKKDKPAGKDDAPAAKPGVTTDDDDGPEIAKPKAKIKLAPDDDF